jgi:hypothetical protein
MLTETGRIGDDGERRRSLLSTTTSHTKLISVGQQLGNTSFKTSR